MITRSFACMKILHKHLFKPCVIFVIFFFIHLVIFLDCQRLFFVKLCLYFSISTRIKQRVAASLRLILQFVHHSAGMFSFQHLSHFFTETRPWHVTSCQLWGWRGRNRKGQPGLSASLCATQTEYRDDWKRWLSIKLLWTDLEQTWSCLSWGFRIMLLDWEDSYVRTSEASLPGKCWPCCV